MQQRKEPTSMFYRLGKKAGYWYAENQHRIIENLVISTIRRFPGGAFLLKIFR
jgi:hypothetical protein